MNFVNEAVVFLVQFSSLIWQDLTLNGYGFASKLNFTPSLKYVCFAEDEEYMPGSSVIFFPMADKIALISATVFPFQAFFVFRISHASHPSSIWHVNDPSLFPDISGSFSLSLPRSLARSQK